MSTWHRGHWRFPPCEVFWLRHREDGAVEVRGDDGAIRVFDGSHWQQEGCDDVRCLGMANLPTTDIGVSLGRPGRLRGCGWATIRFRPPPFHAVLLAGHATYHEALAFARKAPPGAFLATIHWLPEGAHGVPA